MAAITDSLEAGPAEDDLAEARFAGDLLTVSQAAYRLIRSIGLSPEESADALQEASIRAWRRRATRRGEFRPWFLTIAYHEARRSRRRWLTVPTFWRAGDDRAAAPEPSDRVRAALQGLPARQRAAISLRYDADLSNAGTAAVLGISEAAAKQLLARARASLREALAAAPAEVM